MRKQKVLYVLSDVEKSLGFEWLVQKIDRQSFELVFVLMSKRPDTPMSAFLKASGIATHHVRFASKKNLITAFIELARILLGYRPDIVHAHLFDAGRIALPLAWAFRIKKRIYTRHYSTFHHDFQPSGIKYDRIINACSTMIIAVTETVKYILLEKEKVPAEKIVVIPHGFDFSYFLTSDDDLNALKLKYHLSRAFPVVGLISRLTKYKGVQFVIPAFKKLLETYPDAHLVIANAEGDYKAEIHELLQMLPSEKVTLIRFENDIKRLYAMFDVFVHVPIDKYSEAYGQTYVEALAMKVPSVFTLSGIANEFIEHRKNAIVVRHQNSDEITEGIIFLIENPEAAKALAEKGFRDVGTRFDLGKMIKSIESIYHQKT